MSDDELAEELVNMTDHRTLSLFASDAPDNQVVRAPVSRLVVDVERFEDDKHELMAERGMGAIYTVTSKLMPLRLDTHPVERESLILTYYRPHHARLEAAVVAALELHDRCLVIDCHSFTNVALPYEFADAAHVRPDICIGTDDFHTNDELTNSFVASFQGEGWYVSVNTPFAGALVPISLYQQDCRVSAVMVEVNRRLYLNENDATPLTSFSDVAQRIQNCCKLAIATCNFKGDKC